MKIIPPLTVFVSLFGRFDFSLLYQSFDCLCFQLARVECRSNDIRAIREAHTQSKYMHTSYFHISTQLLN
jgi:hypothetical protein